MKQLIKSFKIVTLLLLTLSYIGCDDDDAVLPQIEAGFTHTINQDTGTVTFINTSTNANTYVWQFGDETTSTEINPIKSYTTGVYTVILTAKNVAGATATFQDEITINIPLEVGVPLSFDNPLVKYEPTVFNGASFAVVANPDQSGANTVASNVGAITNSGATFEGLFFELGEPLDLATDKAIKMKFWADAPVSVLLKLEDGTSADVEIIANHGGTGWEEIYFTFDSAGSFSKFTLFVDGAGTTAGTFYFDDVMQINHADVPCLLTNLELPIDFDCNGIDYATKIVGNVSFTVVDNPELSGINATASKVGQITNVGANWENAFFNLDTAIDFSVNSAVKIKIFAAQALPVLLKFEDGTAAAIENVQNHSGNGWEELTFTFDSAASYNDMVIFIDGPGIAAGTFYVDDIEQVAGTAPVTCTPETEENIDPANGDLNWTFKTNDLAHTFEAFGNTGSSIVANPVIDAVNASCNVQQFVKTAGCETWSGMGTELATALDFTSTGINKVFTMKVLAENQVTDVTLRLERLPFPDTDPAIERVANVTQVGEWQELTFDFSDVNTGTYKSVIIYFERNAGCDGDIYYFDDVKQVAGTGGTGGGGGTTVGGGTISGLAINGDFETGDESSWAVFQNGGSATLDNTVNNGGSWSGKLQTNGASNPAFKQERIGAGVVAAGDVVNVSFDHLGSFGGEGSVFNVLLFVEGAGGAVPITHVFSPAPTLSNTWSSFNQSFTIPAGTDTTEGISILIETVCGGAAGCSMTANIDNLSVTLN